jgi:GNAT superfamily N-acetyltransferase
MTLPEILALYDQQQRIAIEYPGMRKDVLPQVVRFVRPKPGMSFVQHSRLDAQNADATITEQIVYLARLVAHGFVPEEPDAIMVLDLCQASAELLAPVAMDVRPIKRREQLADVIAVEAQVWGRNFDWITQRLGDHLEIPGYLQIYVAYVDDQPTCTGWVYFHEQSDFADLWGGSTVPAYRQCGLYTAVLATRVQAARARGYRYLTIDAGPMSRPIVAKHGFQLLTYAHTCEWKP